jgi:hypothetical protein
MKKIFIALCLIIGIGILSSCIQPNEKARVMLGDPPTPEQVVRNFYYEYLDYAAHNNLENYYRNKIYLENAFLDQRFIQTLDGIGDQFNDRAFDPITCSQAHPDSIHVVGADVQGEDIRLSIETDPQDQPFQVRLTVQDEYYVIREILCQDPETNI